MSNAECTREIRTTLVPRQRPKDPIDNVIVVGTLIGKDAAPRCVKDARALIARGLGISFPSVDQQNVTKLCRASDGHALSEPDRQSVSVAMINNVILLDTARNVSLSL